MLSERARIRPSAVLGTAAMCLALFSGSTPTTAQTPLGSVFTYQGKLDLLGSPLNDTADFEFTLWDADVDGNMIGSTVAVDNVTVVDGLFTVEIDFGVVAFNGDNRWLEIAVRSPTGAGVFTTLSPRQPLTVTPYALQTRGIFVAAGGNVGIGTTTPGAKLGVAGEIRVQSKITSSQGSLTLSGGGSGVNVELDEDGGSSDFFTISDTGVERFRVEGDTGNVGIGTTFPSAALDVVGTTELNGNLAVVGGTATVDGNTVWHDGNDGTGSTLDADLLDGQDSSAFLSADASPAYGTAKNVQQIALLRWYDVNTTFGSYSVGNGPRAVAFDGTNIWVANTGSNDVTKLLASDGSLVGTFSVGTNPFGVAFDGTNIWVANVGSHDVTKLLASDGTLVGTFSVGTSPRGVAFDGTNIWVANIGSNDVTKL